MIELHDVSMIYSGQVPVVALSDVTLTIEHGEYVSLQGRSGSGKTTLLNILGILDTPTRGSFLLDRVDVLGLADRDRDRLRGTQIGFVFQSHHLLARRTALENVCFGLGPEGLSPTAVDRGSQALERVGLGDRLHLQAQHLSGGEQQRVAVARALVKKPSLLLCDEPTGQLDSVTAGLLVKIIESIHRDGVTVVMVTHDDDLARRASRRLRLVDGRLIGAT